ncbi:MAG: hypothetical protein AB8E15_02780 [Bdellovibrionales bacterium]
MNVTPRGGGLVFLFLFTLVLVGQIILNQSEVSLILALVFPCLIGLVNVYDDFKGLGFKLRLSIQLFCISSSTFALFHYLELDFRSATIFTLSFGILAATWYTNLYNFMDGINLITCFQTIFLILASSQIFSMPPEILKLLYWSLLPASIAFIFHNKTPAKLFMGDTGSAFIGAFLAIVFVFLSLKDLNNIFPIMILNSLYWVDTSFVLIKRVLTKQKFTEPHRSHLYQILSRRFKSHEKISLLYLCVNILWFLPLALSSHELNNGLLKLSLVLLAAGPVVYFCKRFGAGSQES